MQHPGIMVAGLVLASGIGAIIGFILRGWYDDARRAAARPRPVRARSAPSRPHRSTASNTVRPPAPKEELTAWSHGSKSDLRVEPPMRREPESDRPVVLLVDDRLELLALHGSYLHRHGYTVLTAEDGDTALELARSHRPGVIVLDHSMPGRTGIEVARELKRDPATAKIPVLMMTAHSYGAVGMAAKEAGCEVFMPKPVEPSRMLREVAARIPSATGR